MFEFVTFCVGIYVGWIVVVLLGAIAIDIYGSICNSITNLFKE